MQLMTSLVEKACLNSIERVEICSPCFPEHLFEPLLFEPNHLFTNKVNRIFTKNTLQKVLLEAYNGTVHSRALDKIACLRHILPHNANRNTRQGSSSFVINMTSTGLVFNSIVNDSRLLKAHVQTSKICLPLLLILL